MEVWKSLKGVVELGDYYEVSNLGNIRSVDRHFTNSAGQKRFYKGKDIKPFSDKDGYEIVKLASKGKKKNQRLHRLVALAFIPNPESKPEVNHLDGDVTNNTVSNLEWATGKENTRHARATGLSNQQGEDSSSAKLSEDDVREIRRLHKTGGYTYARLGEIFEISPMQTYRIVKRQRWKHVR